MELPFDGFSYVHDVSADGSKVLADDGYKMYLWDNIDVDGLANFGEHQLDYEFAPARKRISPPSLPQTGRACSRRVTTGDSTSGTSQSGDEIDLPRRD